MQLSARSLFLICSTVANWAFSFGMGSQLVSYWLHSLGENDSVIGFSHAFYYFGMAIASFAVPVIIPRFGFVACVTVGMVLSGITLLAFPWTADEWVWYALRFANGCAGALCVIPLETIVSRDATPELKTRYFAYYGVAITLGGALGFVVAPQLSTFDYLLAFTIGGVVPIAATVLYTLCMLGHLSPPEPEEEHASLAWIANFLAYATGWCQGFLEGGMVAFLQLFLVSQDFSDDAAGVLMGVTTVGVILFQIPVSWLADRYGKAPVLLACYSIVAVSLFAIPQVSHGLALGAILFTFGGCTGAMYPLGLSMLGDHVPDRALPRAYAWFLIIECIGSVAGAAVMGKARHEWGPASMFPLGFAALALVVLLALLLRFTMYGCGSASLDKHSPSE